MSEAALACALLAIDPGLGGAVLRGPPSEARDCWLAALRAALAQDAPFRAIPAHIEDERLRGGLDLAATLAAGRPIEAAGALRQAEGGVLILSGAERAQGAMSAHIAHALDARRFMLIALDESVAGDEALAERLSDRLAFHLELARAEDFHVGAVAAARGRFARVAGPDDDAIAALASAAEEIGIASARAILFAARAARAHAALMGRASIVEDDLIVAARLVLAPRARIAPQSQAEESPPPPPDSQDSESAGQDREQQAGPQERLVAAMEAALPPDLIARIAAGAARRAASRAQGAGARAKAPRRGRPIGARPGALRAGDRLDLLATLRAAAPLQKLRGAGAGRIAIRRGDFRIRRFKQRLESTTIFVVDASGSSAFQRMAEAKGAVEQLLSEAYVTRARVALIAFRDTQAQILLEPTRSLARAKRKLADLPGGGGTPLAAAIETGAALAMSERAKGRTPHVVFLSDGRGNIARDGAPDRVRAGEDSHLAARLFKTYALPAIFIDTGQRPRPETAALASALGAPYAHLPFLDGGAMAGLVRAHAPA